jgi:hypothetical protein
MTSLPYRSTVQMKRIFRALSVLLLLILLVFPLIHNRAYAGTFTNASVTISDSRAGATGVAYNFAFTTTATTDIKQVDIFYCTTPTGSCSAPGGLDVGTPTLASDNLAGTGRTTTAQAANHARIVVTTPATQSTQAVTMSFTGMTNPSGVNTSYYTRVTTYSDTGTTEIDSQNMGFAILDTTSISVTAQVGSTFSFTVAAATTGSVNGASINVNTTTATTIPFGALSSGSTKIAAHDLTVTTNAQNGYSITVKELTSPPLQDSSNNIDEFSGTNATPTTWTSPAGTSANVNTGFFGYTTNDASLGTGTATRFTSSGGNKWAGATTSPLEIAYSATGVSSGETTRIGWQAEVNGLQPAGSYTGTVILVATPTY